MRLFGKADPMDTVEDALRKRGWKWEKGDAHTIRTGVAGPSRLVYLIAIRHDEARKTMVFLFIPAKVPPAGGGLTIMQVHPAAGHSDEQVKTVCLMMASENYTILLGNFERDEQDGEIRFRIAIPFRDTSLTVEQVNWSIEAGVLTLEGILPRLEGVLRGESAGRMVV